LICLARKGCGHGFTVSTASVVGYNCPGSVHDKNSCACNVTTSSLRERQKNQIILVPINNTKSVGCAAPASRHHQTDPAFCKLTPTP
jgi:hypothetical protein